jgi:iron complex outermembrane receptor protein
MAGIKRKLRFLRFLCSRRLAVDQHHRCSGKTRGSRISLAGIPTNPCSRALMILFLGFAPWAVFAQEEETPLLQEVVVTATRQEQEVRKVPANVTVITEEDIKNSNARTTVDLLRSEEGIVVRDLLGNGKTAQVDLRGFGETAAYNSLVLVDGRRVNAIDLSGVDWTQIPLDQIERIEIVRGSGSVLYGDNAVGGVITIITKLPPEGLSATVGVSAGSYDRSRQKASVSGGLGNIAGSVSASYETSDGYRDNNEVTTRDIGAKFLYDPTEYLSLNLTGSRHSDDYGLPGPLSKAEMETDRKATNGPDDDFGTMDEYLNLGAVLDLRQYGELATDFSYRDRETQARYPDVSFPYALEYQVDTWGITPRHTWNGEIFGFTNTLITGADLYRSEMDTTTFSGFFTPVPTLSGTADIDRDSCGVYFHDELSLFENLIVSLGARRERVRYDLNQQDLGPFPLAPLDAKLTERENAYTAGLTFLYGDKSSIFIRANRSLRFPLTDEIVVFDYNTGDIRVNQDLKPQTGRHYETGIRHYFTPDLQAGLTLFRARIKDEIFFNPAPIFANENHPETLHQGIEIGSRADLFEKLTLFGNYTYEKATFEKDPFKNNDIPSVPRNKVSLGFSIHDLVPGLVLSADYNYVGSSYAISDQANEFEKVDSYYTVNGRLSYEWRWLKAFFGVNNITDQEYSEYAVLGGVPREAQFYPAPDRNWVAGLEAVF